MAQMRLAQHDDMTGTYRRLKPMVGTTNRPMADDLRQVDLNGEANKFKKEEQHDHRGRRSVNSFHIKRTRFSAHIGDPYRSACHTGC